MQVDLRPDGASALRLYIADLCDHCHFAADVGVLAMLVEKFHWHGALRFAHKSCTHGLEKEVAGSSYFNFFRAVFKRILVESSLPPAAEIMFPR